MFSGLMPPSHDADSSRYLAQLTVLFQFLIQQVKIRRRHDRDRAEDLPLYSPKKRQRVTCIAHVIRRESAKRAPWRRSALPGQVQKDRPGIWFSGNGESKKSAAAAFRLNGSSDARQRLARWRKSEAEPLRQELVADRSAQQLRGARLSSPREPPATVCRQSAGRP
jgi:hypothetical protein